MSESTADVQATLCATLVDEWLRAGLRHAVVSPGSRSTPLAMALANRSEMAVHVVLDERSAAFVALGIARTTGRASVLLCTSGTAAAEYHPAVLEASLDRVPLVVCTADRPPELHEIGAPQTVKQRGLFGASVRWDFDPGVAIHATRMAWRSVASRSVLEAEAGVRGPGPVHLNLPFREPLLGTALELPEGRATERPWHEGTGVAVDVEVAGLLPLLSGRRGVLVVGAGGPSPAAVHDLAEVLGWPVLADPRSGARLQRPNTVGSADLFLRAEPTARALRPEVCLRFGAPWASKVLNQWLALVPVDVLVDPYDAWLDPNRASSIHVSANAGAVVESLLRAKPARVSAPWLEAWQRVERVTQLVVAAQLDLPGAQLNEAAIARSLMAALPSGASLVVSSSMPIRDIEWFGAPRSGLRVHANRGANGIDGVVSTILGVAAGATTGPVVGLLGDLSFLHDASGLVTAAALQLDVTFVVIDNHGGGIFEFLPPATEIERGRFETLFGTPQPVDIARVAEGFGIAVTRVSSVAELCRAVSAAHRGPRVVLADTDRQANVAVHQRIYDAVAHAVEK